MLSEVDPQFTVGGETFVLSENYHNPEGTFISVIAVGKFKQSYKNETFTRYPENLLFSLLIRKENKCHLPYAERSMVGLSHSLPSHFIRPAV